MVGCREVRKQVGRFLAFTFGFSILTSHQAVMLMETFDRLTRKDKYVWDVSQ